MTGTPQDDRDRLDNDRLDDPRNPGEKDGAAQPAERRSEREDPNRTPGDGTLQDATPAGLSAEELRRRAEETEGSAQPGTG